MRPEIIFILGGGLKQESNGTWRTTRFDEADSFAQPGTGNGRILISSSLAKDVYRECERALRNCKSADMLDEYTKAYKDRLRSLPESYEQELAEEWNRMAEEFSFGRSI